jgi:hypothetical protein
LSAIASASTLYVVVASSSTCLEFCRVAAEDAAAEGARLPSKRSRRKNAARPRLSDL